MTLDKRDLYDSIDKFEEDLSAMLNKLQKMKESLQEVVEKNTQLELENQKLRDHLRELNRVAQEATPTEKIKQDLSISRKNLEKIYEEGFHVCYDLYGSRRANDEPCAFCLEVIYRDSGK
ncbi:DNA replication initiation control protein YabA [Enterococcus columbae]|uniref:Replication initiation control protein YabA n=1 Tax=Enterococcus columbae DSM 7374 = ATCC 51263 TaxID=1121865 RepID=S0KP96_9ENTE|nr:DNA replication initiation control protein YabA [Enterococcus columbae]EOT41863.1 DNA replication initiation control protein YabA [Enterococcus columbae DSM 7374 = ATCC 51263]EOW80658.1 DNA replication initiation control protein YabA [Enterococcus columbae DSM 7374 = ATCC 51263]OJG26259.1 DNA replication initiation control protein YabA [Enterococcus columbae DSM 7374 = ATCC 51263]